MTPRTCGACANGRHIRCTGKGATGTACACKAPNCLGFGHPAPATHGHIDHQCSPECWGWKEERR